MAQSLRPAPFQLRSYRAPSCCMRSGPECSSRCLFACTLNNARRPAPLLERSRSLCGSSRHGLRRCGCSGISCEAVAGGCRLGSCPHRVRGLFCRSCAASPGTPPPGQHIAPRFVGTVGRAPIYPFDAPMEWLDRGAAAMGSRDRLRRPRGRNLRERPERALAAVRGSVPAAIRGGRAHFQQLLGRDPSVHVSVTLRLRAAPRIESFQGRTRLPCGSDPTFLSR